MATVTCSAALALSCRAPASASRQDAWTSSSLSASSLTGASSLRRLQAAPCVTRGLARPRPGAAVCQVSVGDSVPNFSLLDQDGRQFSLSKVKGKNVVLYFYPADDTPGCTKQACSFRDSFDVFRELGAEVIGISGDSPESHKTFAEKYDLPYRLLSDEGNEVRKAFGIPADFFGFLPGRQTYVIDKKGVVQLVFNNQFKPEKHIEETVAILEGLKEEPKAFQFPQLPKFF